VHPTELLQRVSVSPTRAPTSVMQS
jgi:hypothetical protein